MKLTDTHLVMLSSAAQRTDHGVTLPAGLAGSAATKLGQKLLRGGLVQEMPTTGDLPIWRRDGDTSYSLVITVAGRTAIGIQSQGANGAAEPAPSVATGQQAPNTQPATRVGSKRAQLIGLLQQPHGTSLDEIGLALGWLPHTSRAAMSGLRKRGFTIARRRDEDRSIYRIEGEPLALRSAGAVTDEAGG